jgi:anti-sigma regulatory factor (Ser/Thr protein kinase)
MAALGLPDKLIDDGTLVVSETVTNAVVHACAAPRLLVSIVDGRVRLEVHDTSRVLPVLRAPHASAGGQGLRIVAGVADDFGWSTTTTGKFVWAELVPRQATFALPANGTVGC